MKAFPFFLLFLVSVFFSGCFEYQDVEIKEIQSVQLDGMKEDKLNFSIDIALYNPNAYKVKVTKADLDVSIK